jgi:beta-glucosidase
VGWSEPATDSAADRQASEIALQFDFGAWADPIWFGDYPAYMRDNCGELLPRFSDAEKKLIKGSSDFQGVNFYTASFVSAAKRGKPGSGWYVDRNASNSAVAPNGTAIGVQADSPWLYIVPWGLHKMLNWIGQRYGPSVQMVVTENGMDVVAENSKPLSEALHDADRIAYLSSYIGAMGDSISDGYNVTGYFVWSLMDNYEWADGYSKVRTQQHSSTSSTQC